MEWCFVQHYYIWEEANRAYVASFRYITDDVFYHLLSPIICRLRMTFHWCNNNIFILYGEHVTSLPSSSWTLPMPMRCALWNIITNHRGRAVPQLTLAQVINETIVLEWFFMDVTTTANSIWWPIGYVIKKPIMWKCFRWRLFYSVWWPCYQGAYNVEMFFMGVTSTFYYGRDGHFITKTIMWEWYRGGYRVDVRTSATNLFYIFKRTHSIKITTAWSIKRTLAILTINIAAQHMITSINYRVYFEHTNSIQVILTSHILHITTCLELE